MICDTSLVFAIVMRPLSDRWYGFHVFISPFILSLIFWKLRLTFLSLESMVKPTIVKVLSHSMPRSGQSMSFLSVLLPIGMMTFFSILQAKPEILWNAVMYLVA